MSKPQIIVSAVHPIEDDDCASFWNSITPEATITESGYDHDPRHHRGVFHSVTIDETLPVQISYHSDADHTVGEIDIASGIETLQLHAVEEILGEINNRLDPEFSLDVYYWYDGVDRPGGGGDK